MASSRERRVAKELQDIQADRDNSGVMAHLINESDLTHLKGVFPGPPDSPYEGGTFEVDIKIPDNYPFKSPVMKFTTKIWHPNVSSITVRPLPPRSACHLHHAMKRGAGLTSPREFPWFHLFHANATSSSGRHLPRHPRNRLVARRHHQDGADLAAYAARVTEPAGPPGRRGGQDDD